MTTTTDLIIIGSGPGGYRAADYAAKNGLKVIVIEESHAGGTCLNCGCIPTKILCHEAELAGYGLPVDLSKVMQRKQEVIEQLRNGVETLLSQPNISLVRGKASFKDANTVVVNQEEYQAKNIIIATGSHAIMPPSIEGIHQPHVLTSTELLDIDHIPQKLCIIGAGVIGMEFASVFNSFGTEVVVVEFMKECLPNMDSDIAKRLRKCLEKRGIKFYLQSGVKKIDEKQVIFDCKGKETFVEADTVLVATGRGANVDGLNLDAIGIEYNRKGISVDENMRTNVPNIYAIGDVNGRQMLAHAATFQGFRAINHIIGKADFIRFDIMPAAVFTSPEAACVGLTESYCKENSIPYTCHKGYYRANGKALAINSPEGMVKLLTNENDVIIGCHIYGAHAADLIQEISALMNLDTTLNRLHDMIHAHPTLEEILQEIN
ncbi:MAG: dihydrolipoyl dehydrogenase [Prevotella sp.]|nr:dihydrolipoyl dehydrogenase [Prevotella sp.]